MSVPTDVAMRVLVVARDRSFVDQLVEGLRQYAVEVTTALDLDAEVARRHDVALIQDGAGDWASLRTQGGPSVIVLADHADGEVVSACFAAGAADVVTRMDRPYELAARIRAVGRRRPPASAPCDVVRVGEVELNPGAREVKVRGRATSLSRKQFDLLELFLANAGFVLTRLALLDNVWDGDDRVDPNAVEMQIRRLREAIEDDPRHPTRLVTVRGIGYRYERGGS